VTSLWNALSLALKDKAIARDASLPKLPRYIRKDIGGKGAGEAKQLSASSDFHRKTPTAVTYRPYKRWEVVNIEDIYLVEDGLLQCME